MAPGQTVEVKDLPRDLTQAPPDGMAAGGAVVAMPAPSAGPLHGNIDGSAVAVNVGPGGEPPSGADGWIGLLELQAARMLSDGQVEVMDVLGRQFESALIRTALKHTHGRKNDAAIRLGIGRNTITRKIAELGIDGAKDE
jgi:two-component system nitrogen regulation response regulator GlnG